MDGSFSKYATTSAGDIVGASVAALIGRASIPFAFTIRYGFCQSRASLTERYLLGLGEGFDSSAGMLRYRRLSAYSWAASRKRKQLLHTGKPRVGIEPCIAF